jgi:hypothetical protein
LGDNLAWILKFYLNLEFQNLQDIDLHSPGFRNEVTKVNPRLASLIYGDGPELSKFESLKPYRNVIQHRHKLHVHTRWVGNPPRRKIVIPANPENMVQGNKLRENKLIPYTNNDIDAAPKDLPSNINIRLYRGPSDFLL